MQDQPLALWKVHRDEYLEELIRLEGRGDLLRRCPTCPPDGESGRPQYRCRDCFATDLVCLACCLSAHRDRPLDIIEVRFFFLMMIRFDEVNRDGMICVLSACLYATWV